MKYFLTYLILIFGVIYTYAQNDTIRKHLLFSELEADDPVLAAIDSMMATQYFESLGFNDDINSLNKNHYAKDSVPIFDSLTYHKRFSKLNANSPFSLVYNDYTKDYIALYAKRRKKITGRMLGLAPSYFPIFEETLDKYNLPLELKYLPIVESALNPKAKSRVGATGLWQFMYATGKMYGLKVSSYYDERSDVYKSTDAACRYLKDLYNMYHDWDLVLAAYNSGPGNVNKAIRRSGGKTSYWQIRSFLPRETRGYVPAFIAVNYVMSYASEHNIFPILPDMECINTDTIHVTDHVSFAQISESLNIPIKYIEFLNPSYNKNFIPNTDKANALRLPVAKIGDFLTNEKEIYAHKSIKDIKDSIAIAQNKMIAPRNGKAVVYHVRSGDVMGKIAQRYHCRVSQIKNWNNLHSDRLRVGQKLYIYAKSSYLAQNKTKAKIEAKMARNKTTSDGKYIYYTVKEGDNLWDISNKYKGVSVEQLQKLNRGINFKRLKLGTKLKIKSVG